MDCILVLLASYIFLQNIFVIMWNVQNLFYFEKCIVKNRLKKFYISSLSPKGFWYGLKFMDEDQMGTFEPSVERCFFVMMQIMLRNKLTI